jgi:hypothetical protein
VGSETHRGAQPSAAGREGVARERPAEGAASNCGQGRAQGTLDVQLLAGPWHIWAHQAARLKLLV